MLDSSRQAGADNSFQGLSKEIEAILARFSEERVLVGGEALQQWEARFLATEIASLALDHFCR